MRGSTICCRSSLSPAPRRTKRNGWRASWRRLVRSSKPSTAFHGRSRSGSSCSPPMPAATVSKLMAKLEAGRGQGLLGPASVHRFSLLSIFDGAIREGAQTDEIKRVMAIAAQAGVPEVAIDGDLTLAAREHMSVASLLNIVDVNTLRDLFAAARQQ